MSTSPKPAQITPSPQATGGAGTTFEHRVDAFWFAQLLTGAVPPILLDCAVTEVSLQTAHLGWATDDFLITGATAAHQQRRVAGQVKLSVSISAADEEFHSTITSMWRDFNSPSRFQAATDRLALVTLRGSNALLTHFANLLECARASNDASDFEHRLATPGVLNRTAIKYGNEVRKIINAAAGQPVPTSQFLSFLQCISVLSLDLGTSTGLTDAQVLSLLAISATAADPLATAHATWTALIAEAQRGEQTARTYRRDSLAAELRSRHRMVDDTSRTVLKALSDHSSVVLDGIRTTLSDGFRLPRRQLLAAILDTARTTHVTLVTGPAGSGKSAGAREAIETLAKDHLAFAFRAEEFASAHLDDVLTSAQIPVNCADLAAILAANGAKVLLIESVERLLEASTRDAFADLMSLVARDPSWKLILTCREYSVDLVRAAFLTSTALDHLVVRVPPLDDEELRAAAAAHPALAVPIRVPELRRLMRNPYVLNIAARLEWRADDPVPSSEREFRQRFWREVVRVDHRAASGMPARRELAFSRIALRRAQELTLFAKCDDVDSEATRELAQESLIVFSGASQASAAPSHDVLEDWAILGWMDEQFESNRAAPGSFADALGTYPAIRRTYRKWVNELLSRSASDADWLFTVALTDTSLQASFRDDTTVAILKSARAPELLARSRERLLANDKLHLRRVMQLLRVACVRPPDWLGRLLPSSLFAVPDGVAWEHVLQVVSDCLSEFPESDGAALLGFVEDWARGVSWQEPRPPGYEAAFAIAAHLLPWFDNYRSDDERRRALQVLAKVPSANVDRFADILRGHRDERGRDRLSEDLRDILFNGIEGGLAAREVPDVVIEFARAHFVLDAAELNEERRYGASSGVELDFGIRPSCQYDFFPPSAIRGPFLPLLRVHREKALEFVLELLNESCEWYGTGRAPSRYVERPVQITLTYSDGSKQAQWCNARLWNLYRGTSVGPNVLQSALMALELWGLEVAGNDPEHLDALLLGVLRRSNNVAVTAVVASVAVSAVRSSGETLLALMSAKECVLLDRARMAMEAQAASILDPLGVMDQMHRIYNDERKEANSKKHRQHDLEWAIANLQVGPLAPRVHERIEAHLAAAQASTGDAEEDARVWRLALHRMDLRKYTVAGVVPETEGDTTSPEGAPPGAVLLQPEPPDADLQQMVEESATAHGSMMRRVSLLTWGMQVFRRETAATPDEWRERLKQAMEATTESADESEAPWAGGPAFVAAVCIRDHWEAMSESQRAWCVRVTCTEIERDSENWNEMARVQRHGMTGDRPAAWAVSGVVASSGSAAYGGAPYRALVLAVTHPVDEVRSYALDGLGRNLLASDRDVAMKLLNAIAAEASMVQSARRSARSQREWADANLIDAGCALEVRTRLLPTVPDPPTEQLARLPDDDGATWWDRARDGARSLIRRLFGRRSATPEVPAITQSPPLAVAGFSASSYKEFNATDWVGSEALIRMLSALIHLPQDKVTVELLHRGAETLMGWWLAQEDRHRPREIPHQAAAGMTSLLERALLLVRLEDARKIVEILLPTVERYPREAASIIRGLIGAYDRNLASTSFWSIWDLFAVRVRGAQWVQNLDDEHPFGAEVVSAIFLGGVGWKEGIKSWDGLKGHAADVDRLFMSLPPSRTVVEDYLLYLYHIGEASLPGAFRLLDTKLSAGRSGDLLRGRNSMFTLESILQRFVYGRPRQLKSQVQLRDAVLRLLDLMVENGSSAAFRMRDDFITPLRAA